jgi:hypothetical protein
MYRIPADVYSMPAADSGGCFQLLLLQVVLQFASTHPQGSLGMGTGNQQVCRELY